MAQSLNIASLHIPISFWSLAATDKEKTFLLEFLREEKFDIITIQGVFDDAFLSTLEKEIPECYQYISKEPFIRVLGYNRSCGLYTISKYPIKRAGLYGLTSKYRYNISSVLFTEHEIEGHDSVYIFNPYFLCAANMGESHRLLMNRLNALAVFLTGNTNYIVAGRIMAIYPIDIDIKTHACHDTLHTKKPDAQVICCSWTTPACCFASTITNKDDFSTGFIEDIASIPINLPHENGNGQSLV
jgi:hypothetical protein